MTGPRRLSEPRPATVRSGAGGQPVAIDGRTVEAVRETWLLVDRWWTERPLRRRYWELIAGGGRNVVVFHDLQRGGWFTQR